MTVAEHVAATLAERGIKHVFGVIGSGNAAIFDAIAKLGKTEIVACHHEQAAVMAANAYYRVSGTVTCALVTTGAGSSNAVTGVLSAYMDSIPLVVIAGQEPSSRRYVGRSIGVQGFNASSVVGDMAVCLEWWNHDALNRAFALSQKIRPGPVWLEIPQDVQVGHVGA